MTSENMIERIARELWQCANDDAGPVNQCYGKTADEGWPSYMDDARRVIAAMRDPPETMIQAGNELTDTYYSGDNEFAAGWNAAIDAALTA